MNDWFMLHSLVSAVKQSCQKMKNNQTTTTTKPLCSVTHAKQKFLVSPVFHALKVLVITNSILMYINIFFLDHCD